MKRELWRNFDFWLFGASIFLSIFGIMMIQSAIAGNEVLAAICFKTAHLPGFGHCFDAGHHCH